MPLRQTIKASPETFSDMLLAADDRYREGEELIVAQEYDAGVYLLGYAAEMWLKAACLRLNNIGPAGQVKAALPAIKKWMKTNVQSVVFSYNHDLSFFAAFIIEMRIYQQRPLSKPLLNELRNQIINGLFEEWIVDMRYRRSGVGATGAWSALNSTWWMKNNWLKLT